MQLYQPLKMEMLNDLMTFFIGQAQLVCWMLEVKTTISDAEVKKVISSIKSLEIFGTLRGNSAASVYGSIQMY